MTAHTNVLVLGLADIGGGLQHEDAAVGYTLLIVSVTLSWSK